MAMRVLLVSTYELGHQPLHVAAGAEGLILAGSARQFGPHTRSCTTPGTACTAW